MTQALVWCFATFTEMRYSGPTEARAKQAPIVITSETRKARELAAAQANSVERAAEVAAVA